MFNTSGLQEVDRPSVSYLSTTPYNLLTIPFSIRPSYSPDEQKQIKAVSHYVGEDDTDGLVYCEIEILIDGRYRVDIWENMLTPDNQWMHWKAWKRISSEFDD